MASIVRSREDRHHQHRGAGHDLVLKRADVAAHRRRDAQSAAAIRRRRARRAARLPGGVITAVETRCQHSARDDRQHECQPEISLPATYDGPGKHVGQHRAGRPNRAGAVAAGPPGSAVSAKSAMRWRDRWTRRSAGSAGPRADPGTPGCRRGAARATTRRMRPVPQRRKRAPVRFGHAPQFTRPPFEVFWRRL